MIEMTHVNGDGFIYKVIYQQKSGTLQNLVTVLGKALLLPFSTDEAILRTKVNTLLVFIFNKMMKSDLIL